LLILFTTKTMIMKTPLLIATLLTTNCLLAATLLTTFTSTLPQQGIQPEAEKTLSSSRARLLPQVTAPLYEHLYEINEQWLTETSPVDYLAAVNFSDDSERIRTHLQLVEEILRTRPVTHLTAKQQRQRSAILDHLQTYWHCGLFPINSYQPNRLPVFVDEANTACAVGYLLQATGEQELVTRIRAENNFADLQELLIYAELPTWAEASGFTADELAWIQPAYAVLYFDAFPFGNDEGISGGQILDMQVYNDELYMAGTFSHIDGFAADHLVAWDGNELRSLAGFADLDGGFFRMAIDEDAGDIYAIGAFSAIAGQEETQIFARYRSGSWERLLEVPATEGTFTDLLYHQGYCYLSGDFDSLAGNDLIQKLGAFNTTSDTWEPFNEQFRLTGIIRDLDILGDSLLAGGHTLLLSEEDTLAKNILLLNTVERSFLAGGMVLPATATWQVDDYIAISIHRFFTLSPDNTYAGVGRLMDSTLVIFFTDNLWYTEAVEMETEEPITINGFYGPRFFIFGALQFPWIQGQDPFVITTVPGYALGTPFWPIIQADGAVTALADFRGELIMAGDFTEIDGIAINNLARTSLLISDTEEEVFQSLISVGTDGRVLFVQHLPPVLAAPARLELFDMNGRQVWSQEITDGTATQFEPSSLPAGSYAYRLLVDGELAVGQVVLVR
jgi:hypothetical protein